jgi:hypothetical protein
MNSPDFVYYERHHILPRSLGGSDGFENLVLLTGFEHFVVHWLLVKMAKSQRHINSLVRCLTMLKSRCDGGNLKSIARMYEMARHELAVASSMMNKGRKMPESFSQLMKERMTGENNCMWGKSHAAKTVEKMSLAKRGEHNPNYQRNFSQEHRRKIGEVHKAKQYGNKTYEVTFPDGSSEIVKDRLAFCKKHGFDRSGFGRAALEGRLYHGLAIKELSYLAKYEIKYPDGRIEIIESVKDFCTKNGYAPTGFHLALRKNRPYKGLMITKIPS